MDILRWFVDIGLQISLAIASVSHQIENALPSTVNFLEIAWCMPTIIGSIRYPQRYTMEFIKRRRNKRLGINGEVQLMGSIRCIRFAGLSVVFELLLGVAIVAMMEPQGNLSDVDEFGAWIITLFLFAVPIALIILGEVEDLYTRLLVRLSQLYRAAGKLYD